VNSVNGLPGSIVSSHVVSPSTYRLPGRLTWLLPGVALATALLSSGTGQTAQAAPQATTVKPVQTAPAKPTPTTAPASAGSSRPGNGPGPGREGQGPRPDYKPWWQDPEVKKAIGLSEEKAQRIQKIWDDARDQMVKARDETIKQQKELDRLMSVDVRAPIDVVMMQIDRVEAQRMMANKLKTITLYKMHSQLTREQDQKLSALDRDHGRRGGGPHD